MSAIKMLLNTCDVDVIKACIRKTANVLRLDAIMTAAVVFTVVDVPEDAEWTFCRGNIQKMIFLYILSYAILKSIGDK